MLRKIDKVIKSCLDCPYKEYTLERSWVCTETGDSIGNVDLIPNNCHLPDAGVKTGTTVMMIRNGKVVLGERGEEVETAKNVFAFPGGRMDYGEKTPEDALVREIKEETGLVINKERLKFFRPVSEFFPDENKHYVSLVYVLELTEEDGEPEAIEGKEKCKGWKLFFPDEIPKNTYIHTKKTIKLYFNELKTGINQKFQTSKK